MDDKTASQQIDDIIKMHSEWKGNLLTQLRTVILKANPDIQEEIKWRMKTRPEGLAVWTKNGIICFTEIWKDNIKLLFPKGAQLNDEQNIFNSRLQSKDIRAIEFKETNSVNETALAGLVIDAIRVNNLK